MRFRYIAGSSRRATVLILVLWLLVLLGIIGLAYSTSVRTQIQVHGYTYGKTQAWWAARAGVEKARIMLAEPRPEPIGPLDPIFDSDEECKNQKVGRAVFSLIVPPADLSETPRYGLVDEASRLNINVAEEELMRLPSMTLRRARSLLDWRDADTAKREFGAEDTYYASLMIPYRPRNAPFNSVQELAFVRGWTDVFDIAWPDPFKTPNPPKKPMYEQQPIGGKTIKPIKGQEARELINWLTAWSADEPLAPDGKMPMNLATVRSREIMNRIPGLALEEARAIVRRRRTAAYGSALDIMSVMSPQAPAQRLFDNRRASELMDYFTAETGTRPIPGRINLNTAPREVLMTLPGIDEPLAIQIVEARRKEPLKGAGRLLALNGMKEETFRQLYPKVTARARRFHVTSRGREPVSGATVTIEAVLELNEKQPQILYCKEIYQP